MVWQQFINYKKLLNANFKLNWANAFNFIESKLRKSELIHFRINRKGIIYESRAQCVRVCKQHRDGMLLVGTKEKWKYYMESYIGCEGKFWLVDGVANEGWLHRCQRANAIQTHDLKFIEIIIQLYISKIRHGLGSVSLAKFQEWWFPAWQAHEAPHWQVDVKHGISVKSPLPSEDDLISLTHVSLDSLARDQII